jgi:hypothetical protein
MVAELSWLPSGQPNQYAVVTNDSNALAGNWTARSGGLLGLGNGSQAQLANAEVVTQVLAATCTGDTQAGRPICAPPLYQPNGTGYVGGTGGRDQQLDGCRGSYAELFEPRPSRI